MSQMNTPPISSDFDIPDAPPAWPKVVGIISIVLASLHLLCGLCGTGSMMFMGQLLKMAEQQLGPAPSVMFPGPALIGLALVGTLWSLVLMVAGIATVRRRANGRGMHIVYSALSVLLTIVSTLMNMQYQGAIASWAAANPTDKWAQQQSSLGNVIGLVVGVLLGLAYPLFLLIWFGMLGKRPEVGSPVEEPIV